jgi:hypothetical protein
MAVVSFVGGGCRHERLIVDEFPAAVAGPDAP